MQELEDAEQRERFEKLEYIKFKEYIKHIEYDAYIPENKPSEEIKRKIKLLRDTKSGPFKMISCLEREIEKFQFLMNSHQDSYTRAEYERKMAEIELDLKESYFSLKCYEL